MTLTNDRARNTRREDARFLSGRGRYLDDIRLPGETHAVFVRSAYAHADVGGVEVAEASAVDGVLGVVTGADLARAGLGDLPTIVKLRNRDGTRQTMPRHPALATDRVRYVGEPVALVVAETLPAAKAAAERVNVDYVERPAVSSIAAASAEAAAPVWNENNVCLDWEVGDAAAVADAFSRADHVTELSLGSNRIAANPIETRGALAEFDAGLSRYTLHVSSQGVHKLQALLARDVLHIPMSDLRVITPDVGGGFGTKIYVYSEYAVLLWAARRFGRPTRWVAERSESFLSDAHARDQSARARLALDRDGLFLGLEVDAFANLGAYLSTYGAYIPTVAGSGMLTGLYHLSAVHCRVQCVFSNTVPLDAYRGAGKPEFTFILERLIDTAARETGRSPVELRRRNLVSEKAMPYTTALGFTFDSGAFEHNLDQALEKADWSGMSARKESARRRGRRRGIGLCAYFENTAGYQEEQARVHVNAEGGFTLSIGTQSNGQGHETTFAQVLAQLIGVPLERIRLLQGDTDTVPHGHGTGGSRSLVMGGAAVVAAAEQIVEKSKRIAAHLLEAAEPDVELTRGSFAVSGTDHAVSFDDVAAAAYNHAALPKGMEPGLMATGTGMPGPPSFPNGVHVCEVEVDVETGVVDVVRYTVVDDFGNLINPPIVEGQVHGGTVQGVGQALLEDLVYDDAGQLLSGSFMDYALPRADNLPNVDVHFNCVPCTTNPLGVKGCGEAGAIAAPAAVINALVDALAEDGVRHVPMPATSEAIWRALALA